MLKSLKTLNKKTPYTKNDYMMLLAFMFNFFKFSNSKTPIEIENHIDNPLNSDLFQGFPIMMNADGALPFFCDYFRMSLLGFNKTMELQNMMEDEIESKRHHAHEVASSLLKIGDALPALGIVAAVLGVIIAMASVGSDASVLGPKIASALVGTFIGAFTSYGVVSPIGHFIEKYGADEVQLFECMKAGVISYMSGASPSIATEFARQAIPHSFKPTFIEVEDYLKETASTK